MLAQADDAEHEHCYDLLLPSSCLNGFQFSDPHQPRSTHWWSLCLDFVVVGGVPLHQDYDMIRGLEQGCVVWNTQNYSQL